MFPKDKDGKSLAWPDPNQPDLYVDAWNGIYSSRTEALEESRYWTALESDRILVYGETFIDEEEMVRRGV